MEHYIAFHACDYLIVRTTVVYGWESQGKNFIQRLVGFLREGKRVRAPYDQIGTPTYAPNLAEAVVELATLKVSGIFHVVGPEIVSRYGFALAAARTFGLNPELIESVSTQELGQVAPRPLKAGMRIGKVQGLLKTRLVGYVEGLKIMAAERR
jgi:dTDP-4-dehydrorhamnose reductase